MKIRLKEIPQEGRQYAFDRTSGELNESLADIIGDHAYDVKLFIKPIGNAYEMRGQLATTVLETCSHCGYEFDLPITRAINEVLFEEEPEYRKTHSVQGNQSIDFEAAGPAMTPIHGDVLDAGEFVHEMIALEEPFYPVCGTNKECLHAEEVDEIRRRLEEESSVVETSQKPNPFSVLKGIDLAKKN